MPEQRVLASFVHSLVLSEGDTEEAHESPEAYSADFCTCGSHNRANGTDTGQDIASKRGGVSGKQSRVTVSATAREAVQMAENARLLALRCRSEIESVR